MLTSLLIDIGLPLIFAIPFMILNAALDPSANHWEVIGESALDLTILSMGATGAVFDNDHVRKAFGNGATLAAIVVIGTSFLCASLIVYVKSGRAIRNESFTQRRAILCLAFGVLTVVTTSTVLIWGYTH